VCVYIYILLYVPTLEKKLGAAECESGNVEVHWNSIKKCVPDTMSVFICKVDRRARKPWISQEMINKMDEQREWKNVNNKEGSKNYRRLRNELKGATYMAKKSIWRACVTKSWNFKEQDIMI